MAIFIPTFSIAKIGSREGSQSALTASFKIRLRQAQCTSANQLINQSGLILNPKMRDQDRRRGRGENSTGLPTQNKISEATVRNLIKKFS